MRLKPTYLFYCFSFSLGVLLTLLVYSLEGPTTVGHSVHFPLPESFTFKIVILVISHPNNSEKRRVIRETWGSDASKRVPVKLLFVIGEGGLSSDMKLQLFKEQIAHSDLLFLPLEDLYDNLTRKLLLSLKVAYDEYKFEYLLKCDDDTYINFPLFMKEVERVNNSLLLWGYFSGRAKVKTEGKWKQDGWFLCDRYLPYPLGGGYVVGRGIIEFITNNQNLLSLYKNEDVSLGLWTAPLNITRVHDIRFATEYISRGCKNHYLVLHKKTVGEMKKMYANQKEKGVICTKEHLNFLPYSYNWENLPSECCTPIRNKQ